MEREIDGETPLTKYHDWVFVVEVCKEKMSVETLLMEYCD